MIDIHSHILYGLDDGAKDLEETVKMLHIAAKDGIKKMIATPHYIYGSNQYDINQLNNRLHKVQSLIQEEELDLVLYSGNELYMDYNLSSNLQQGHCLTLADTDYVLVEFPMNTIPDYTENVLYSFFENGYRVILAHPERYIPVQNDPETLYQFIEMGCLVQVNALSITGETGARIKGISKRFIEKNWVHFVAGDSHSPRVRAPKLRLAYEQVTEWVGKKKADELFVHNAELLLENEIIQPEEWAQEPIRTRSFSFLPFINRKTIRF